MTFTGKQLTTQLDADGTLTVQLNDKTWEAPQGTQVLIRVEATPINPSDLGLLMRGALSAVQALRQGGDSAAHVHTLTEGTRTAEAVGGKA